MNCKKLDPKGINYNIFFSQIKDEKVQGNNETDDEILSQYLLIVGEGNSRLSRRWPITSSEMNQPGRGFKLIINIRRSHQATTNVRRVWEAHKFGKTIFRYFS